MSNEHRTHWRVLIFCLLLLTVFMLLPDIAWAQAPPRGPFGLGDGRPTAPPSGFVAWMLARQAEFHRTLLAALRQVQSGGGPWLLVTAAFLYGLFHAAGPGHGKAVVSSYVFANERALRRGVAISFVAALIQALIAIAVVWIVLTLFAATARQVDSTVRWIEIASFALIAGFGAVLTFRKSRALFAPSPQSGGAAACEECGGRFQLSYRRANGAGRNGAAALAAGPAPTIAATAAMPACGHVVIPDSATLTGTKSWSELAAIAFAAGSRPCTGAILVLALARANDMFGVGIVAVLAMALGTALATSGFAIAASTAKSAATALSARFESSARAIAIVELLGAIAVLVLGLSLLAGFLAAD